MARKKVNVDAVSDANIVETSLSAYADMAFKRYAVETIEGRALPDIYDGLKPVARRILYAMYKAGMTNAKEPSKAARVTGNTMAGYHPHGDSSIFTALVTMVNSSCPPVYGHGNWGTIQEPTPGAARYINCRLSDYGMTMVDPDYLAVTPMMPNYDDKDTEPVVLPALLPNLFFNGAFGIAVGLTTDVPPMEPSGIIELCRLIMQNKAVTPIMAAKLTRVNPKYGGIQFLDTKESKEEWVTFWRTGFSSLWIGPGYTHDAKARLLYLNAFPDSTDLHRLLDQLREHPQVEYAEDITDVTSERACVVEIKLKRAREFESDMYEVLDLAYARIHPKTSVVQRRHVSVSRVEDLQVRFHQKSPLDLLHLWCKLRVDLERNCLKYKIERLQAQIHKTEMFILACVNRAAVIKSLESKDPDATLAKSLKISLEDATLILNMQVRRLSTMDEGATRKKLAEQKSELKTLQGWLKEPQIKVIADMQQWLASHTGG